MNRIVDGGVQQDVHAQREVDAATRDLTVNYRHVVDPSGAQELMSPEEPSQQVLVGDIPRQPLGYLLRPYLMAQLNRSGRGVSVLVGAQGAGKTQLAAAYARAKLAEGWRLVAWVNAADAGSLHAGLAAVAEAIGLTDSNAGYDAADAGEAVRHLLETDGDRCLLVFDDAVDPESLRPFVPVGGSAQVLVTSVRPPTGNWATGVPVDVFSANEALRFLTGRIGLDDEAGAAAVVAVLGQLPLTLALAAPVIGGQPHGYAWYLDQLKAISTQVFLTGNDSQPYPHTVARAVLLSLAVMRAADQTGVSTRLIEIVAVLSAAGVRRELLHAAGQAGVLGSGGRRVDAVLVDRVLEVLSDRSLLTFSLDGRIVSMHHHVAQIVRDRLARRQRLGAVCWVAACVLEAYATALAGSRDRLAVRSIPQHVMTLLDNTPRLARRTEELANILLGLRFIALYHLIELGDSNLLAIAVGEALTTDLERLMGRDHPDTLNSRNSLAAAYLAAGRAAEAIPLFEQTLAFRQRLLGLDDPDTLTSRNNLAAAYQDAGRAEEAIQLFEQTASMREQLDGADHPSSLNARGNLATAYRDAGRAAEAIPLFEQVLVDRERVLGHDHPDTQVSRKNLANAYRDVGRTAEAIPLFEQVLADRKRVRGPAAGPIPSAERTVSARESQPPVDAAGHVLHLGFRRPPIDPAKRVLPSGFRRPPTDPARRLLSGRVAAPAARLTDRSTSSRTQDPQLIAVRDDREVVAAIVAGNPAGLAKAYDRYAAGLYGYCQWMLQDTADAGDALQAIFVIAVATLRDLLEPSNLRPWLYAVARRECRRRLRTVSPARDKQAVAAEQRAKASQPGDAAGQSAEAADWLIDATMPIAVIGQPTNEPIDATMPFRAISQPTDAPMPFRAISQPTDATMPFRAISQPIDATMPFRAISQPIDATMPFRAISQPIDATMPFRAISQPIDAPMPFRAISQPIDAPMPFRAISQPIDAIGGLAHVNGGLGQAELRALVGSELAALKAREREAIELSFRHDLLDNDLAIALGVSRSGRVQILASRARRRLEKSFSAMHATLAGRQACPVLGELLVDWNGQLTERTRDLTGWHIEQCQTCANHGSGALRPKALSSLLPLAPLPPELRKRVLSSCLSTAQDAVAYRRRVVRRAESTWFAIFAIFSRAVRRMSWDSIRANPGPAVAAVAVAAWVAAAVSVTLLTVAGIHVARALETQPSIRTPASSPAAPVVAPTAPITPLISASPTSASASPSPTFTPSPTYVPSAYVPPASPTAQATPSPSASHSPKPSNSSEPSKSPSPSPSQSGSPSPSPSGRTSKAS